MILRILLLFVVMMGTAQYAARLVFEHTGESLVSFLLALTTAFAVLGAIFFTAVYFSIVH